MDDRYPIKIMLNPREYAAMCQIVAAQRSRPLISVDRSTIENYVHNMIFDLVREHEREEK